MNYYSLNRKTKNTSFEKAVTLGLAPDKGLFFPNEIKPLDPSFFETIDQLSDTEIAFQAIKQFISPEIPEDKLYSIVKDTLVFDFPIVELEDRFSFLELFHGPTMAFKDVGARFMARCLGYFNQLNTQDITVLVATSGDTGGAVADGFLGVSGVNVVILYPKGKVSKIQEKQLTTLGQNIVALQVDGTFDDCQDMVKRAFIDKNITSKIKLTSANSINVARWLPQMFYFLIAYKQLKSKHKEIVFSVPSGNFGNICAGMLAQQMGMPVQHFIAACNANDTVAKYMQNQKYLPKPSIQTISNAMDVGNPSNFIRILELYKNKFDNLKINLSAKSFSNDQTRDTIKELYDKYKYIADPHAAVGYLGAKDYLNSKNDAHVVILETAHPAKFLDIVEASIQSKVRIPKQLSKLLNRLEKSIPIHNYKDLKSYLIE